MTDQLLIFCIAVGLWCGALAFAAFVIGALPPWIQRRLDRFFQLEDR